MTIIGVKGSGFLPYDVVVGHGALSQLGQRAGALFPGRRLAVVADAAVAQSHGRRALRSLEDAGSSAALLEIPSGEATKSFAELQALCSRLFGLGLDRGDALVALGGGVTGDLVGFAAAIFKRGIDVIQVPTTLLAQVDSSVGGKTAIDAPEGKNLVGAFWHPRLVLCDLEVLSTLPDREMRCGLAEILKYGLLGNADFFAWLERTGPAILARDGEALARAVSTSVAMKASIVGDDPREGGARALLNLGHTFGHALESEAGFDDRLKHGEAVALGMAMAFRCSAGLGLCDDDDVARVEAAIAAAGLPIRLDQIDLAPPPADRLLGHMRQDKKAEGGAITLILARGIGQAFVARRVDQESLRRRLVEEGALP